MRRRKQKRRKENIKRIRSELEKEGIRVKNNPDTPLTITTDTLFIISEINSGINSLSNKLLTCGLAIIGIIVGIIVAFGLTLLSAL